MFSFSAFNMICCSGRMREVHSVISSTAFQTAPPPRDCVCARACVCKITICCDWTIQLLLMQRHGGITCGQRTLPVVVVYESPFWADIFPTRNHAQFCGIWRSLEADSSGAEVILTQFKAVPVSCKQSMPPVLLSVRKYGSKLSVGYAFQSYYCCVSRTRHFAFWSSKSKTVKIFFFILPIFKFWVTSQSRVGLDIQIVFRVSD